MSKPRLLWCIARAVLLVAWLAAACTFERPPRVTHVALADLNDDGLLDAVLALGGASNVAPAYVLYNTGGGTFGRVAALDALPGDYAAIGDLTGDGQADILLGLSGGGLAFYSGQGGRFAPALHIYDSSPHGLMSSRPVIGDLNGDGRLDMVTAGCCGRPPGSWVSAAGPNTSFLAPYSEVRLQSSGGQLLPVQKLGNAPSQAAALADLNGNGALDIFLANTRYMVQRGYAAVSEPNTVWLNDGSGSFIDSGQLLGQAESLSVALGDVNGDGAPDAVVGNNGPDEVWLNDGSGNFTDSGQQLGNSTTRSVYLADLNGNGHLDIFAVDATSGRAWFNDGSGTFSASRQVVRLDGGESLAVGDLDGDGFPDLLVAGISRLQVWLNDGNGQFDAQASVAYR
jgi:hypothetical protein